MNGAHAAHTPRPSETRLDGVLDWVQMLGAPVAWYLQQQTSYALVPLAARHGATWAIHASTVVFALVAGACGLLALHRRRSARAGMADGYATGRARFMNAVGLMISALFLLLILIQGLSVLFFPPAET
jgi:hypothetical protein